jgi:hypothetical protein
MVSSNNHNHNHKNRNREYKVTLNDDEMSIINRGLLMLAKEGYDNSFKDTKDIENYQRKLIVLMDVFMAW